MINGEIIKRGEDKIYMKAMMEMAGCNYVSIPLFINIKSNFDLTYTPTIFSKNNINQTC